MLKGELIFKVAMAMIPQLTAEAVRHIADCGMSPEEFFSAPPARLAQLLGMPSPEAALSLGREAALDRARAEVAFMERHNIRGLFLLDSDYPERLAQIPDAPVLLYQLGELDLDAGHSVAMVGTRRCTAYGSNFTAELTEILGSYFPNINIVSGLAYGIDAAAHSAALGKGLRTTAVVAHGLDMIYPAPHRGLASQIVSHGGCILTEYPSGVRPFRNNFLQRNRIVAALSEATVVVESPVRGGAMSTANAACSYGREVFALPGRVSDEASAGCNRLIRLSKAQILTSAADLVDAMGWTPTGMSATPAVRNLFPEMDGDLKTVYDFLRGQQEPQTADSIRLHTGLPMSNVMAALGELEFDGVTLRQPGGRYSIS